MPEKKKTSGCVRGGGVAAATSDPHPVLSKLAYAYASKQWV